MEKRGFEMSFNFILSIIIIVFILATAGYAIKHFLDLQRCSQLGYFYKDLQGEIDKSWNSEIAQATFSGAVSSGITSVCIGNVSLGSGTKEYAALRKYQRQDYLLFFYPPEKACERSGYALNHLDASTRNRFSCYPVTKGKISFTISKDSAASLVSIRP